MDEDIDVLLEDILQDSGVTNTKKTSRRIEDDDEVDDLLDLTEGATDSAAATPASHPSPSLSQLQSSSQQTRQLKCQPIILAGSDSATGLSTTLSPRSCDNLFCLSCDFRVASFDNFAWHGSTDYLFLRNSAPEFSRLKSRLSPAGGSRAYCCQCRHWSTRRPETLEAVNARLESDLRLRWTCMKHGKSGS